MSVSYTHLIEVETGVCEDECRRVNEVFFHYITHKTPFVTLKYLSLIHICDADGAAADADLDEVRAGLSEEAEALTVNNVSRADLNGVLILRAYPLKGAALPLGETLGGVDAENVCARLNQCRNTLCVVCLLYTSQHETGHPSRLQADHDPLCLRQCH